MVDFGPSTELDIGLGKDIFDLVEDLGKTVAITINDDPTSAGLNPDAAEGSRLEGGASTEYEVKITPPFPSEKSFIPLSLLKDGDMVFYLSAYGRTFNLVAGSIIEMPAIPNNEFWRVVASARIWSGEQQVLWQVAARQRI